MRNKSKKLIAIMAAMMIAGSTVAATATVASAATSTDHAYYQSPFDSMGGSAVAPQRVKASGTDNLTVNEPTAPTLAGYTFAGWYSDVNYTKPVTFTAGTATVAAADWDDTFTLYAK